MESELFTDVLASPRRERCAELALVLESQSIHSQIRWSANTWVLSVPASVAPLARLEIEAYAAETRIGRAVAPPPQLASGNPWLALAVYAAVLLVMALAAPALALGIDWFAAGRIDAGRVLAGEWWRTVTALSLHADAAHLLGNLAFGSFFGYSVARYIGAGFGWMSILICGALGNFANVLLSGAGHRSIGASTAVFAALGILSAYCWRRGFPSGTSSRERFAPVVAGIGLLAFTGTAGANTDLGAHLFGFVAGFGGGLLIARFGFPTRSATQRLAGIAAVGLLGVAWLAAIS